MKFEYFIVLSIIFTIFGLASRSEGNYIDSSVVNVKKFGNLSTAKSSGATKGMALLIDDEQITSSITISKDRTLIIGEHGRLFVRKSHVVKIDGIFHAKSNYIFTGSGGVLFGQNSLEVVYPQWWGAKGDGISNDVSSIQSAIDAVPKGGRIYLKSGVYRIIPQTVTSDEAGPRVHVAFVMRSGMKIIGQDGAVIKIADNVSTDSIPKPMHMFFSNKSLNNIEFKNITFDMNGQNNKISPERPKKYNRFNQSAIAFSGTIKGMAASGDNVLIDSCKFINGAGTSSIIMALSNTPHVRLGRNWIVTNCVFRNNGIDTDDHSSVFGWADDVDCHNNIFESDPVMHERMPNTGGRVAMEIHGARHKFYNNVISNYYRGLWISSNYTSVAEDIRVYNNRFDPVRVIGVDCYRSKSIASPIENVHIENNIINLDDSPDKVVPKCGIRIASSYETRKWFVSNNVFTKSGNKSASVFVMVASQSNICGEHDDLHFNSNSITGAAIAFYVKTSHNCVLGDLFITGNYINELTYQGAFRPIGIGVSGDGRVHSLVSNGNYISSTNNAIIYGHYIDTIINSLAIYGNFFNNVVKEYQETARAHIVNKIPKK